DLALELAARGFDVTGVDFAEKAIDRARAKASERGLRVAFHVMDVLQLAALGESFDTVLDCGLFHVFDDRDQRQYVAGLGAVTRPGGSLFLLAFSDRERGKVGPRRLTEAELRAAFAEGWRVVSLEPAKFESNVHEGGAEAWLMEAARL